MIGAGTSAFNPSTASLNWVNPPRRDTMSLPAGGWMVIAFELDNPGAWLCHCHIPYHSSGGFDFQFLESPDQILSSIGDLSGLTDGCQSWDSYSQHAEFQQQDSGL